MRIVVLHGDFGCDTGCCGHAIEFDDGTHEDFTFEHPDRGESDEDFVRRLVIERWGEEHCADIDFESCIIVYG